MSSSPGQQEELKLPGIAAEELRAFGKAVKVFEKQMLERKLLGEPLQQQAFSASTQVLYRAIELYGQHITSATISVVGDGVAALWGGGILGEVKALQTAVSTDSQIEKSLNALARAIGLEADFPAELPSVDEEQVPIEKAQAVLRSLQGFVQGVTKDAPAIRLPKEAKALEELKKAPTPAAGLTRLVPTLDIKPLETAFPLIMSGWRWKEPPSYKKEEDKKTPQEKGVEAAELAKWRQLQAEERELQSLLGAFFQPLQAVGEQWLSLLDQCIGEEPFLPKEALDVIDAFLKVYEKVEQEVFSHSSILKWAPPEFVEAYRKAIPEFREDVQKKMAAWRKAFAEQQAIISKAAQANADKVADLKRSIDAEQKHRLPDDKTGLSVQMQALEEHIQRLEDQAKQLSDLAEEEDKSLAQAQDQLPAISINWQMLAPASVVPLADEDRDFKVGFAIDCQPELHEHYQKALRSQTSAAKLKEEYESQLEKFIQERCDLLANKKQQHQEKLKQAQDIAARFIADKQKILEEKAPADLFQAYDYLTRLIAEAKRCQGEGVGELSALIQKQCPELTPAECRALAQKAMDGLNLGKRIQDLTAQQERVKQDLLQQADKLIKEYIQTISAEFTPPSAADLKEEKDEKLETVLERLELEIKIEEAKLHRLAGLEGEMAENLNAQLAKFSAVLTDQDREARIRQASSALGIEQRQQLQQKHVEALRQRRYDIHMRIIAQSGDAKALGTEYKKTKERIEFLEQEEKKLSAQILKEEKELEELKLDQEERVSQKTALRQGLASLRKKEEELALQIAELKLQQAKEEQQSQTDAKEIGELEERSAWLAKNILALEKNCKSLDDQIGSYKAKLAPMKARHNVYAGFRSGSPQEKSDLEIERNTLIAQKDQEEQELKALREEQAALLQKLKALQAKQVQTQRGSFELAQQVASLEQTKDISSQITSTSSALKTLEDLIVQQRIILEQQAAEKAQLEAELQSAKLEKTQLEAQNEKIKAQLKEVFEKQFELQAARLKELSDATESALAEIQVTRHKVIETERKAGVATSRYVPAVVGALLSEKAFEKRQAARAKLDGWRKVFESCRAARDELLEVGRSSVGDDSFVHSSVSVDPFEDAEALLRQFQKDFQGEHNVGKDVLGLLESSISSSASYDSDDLWFPLQVKSEGQKKWAEALADSEQKLVSAQESKQGYSPSIVLQAAEALRQAATADIPKFTTDPWFVALASIEASLSELEKQGEEAQAFAKAAREKIAKTAEQRAKIIQEEAALAEKSKTAVQKAKDAAALALEVLQPKLAAHKEQLESAKQAFEKREAELKSVVAQWAAAETMAPGARLASAKEVLDCINAFEQKAVDFALWSEETIASLEANLAMAKQLQPDLVQTLEKEIADVRSLQTALPTAQKALKDNIAKEKEKAQAAYEKAYSDQIAELEYYQKCAADWLANFEKQRANEHFWQDGLEWFIFGLVYILTFTLVEIKTEKAEVREKIEQVNGAFGKYVQDVKGQQAQALDKPEPQVSYGLLMSALGTEKAASSTDSAKKPRSAVKPHSEDLPVKSSALLLPTDSDSLVPRLKVVGEVAEKFSPQNMGLPRVF